MKGLGTHVLYEQYSVQGINNMICGDQLYLHTYTCRIEYVLDTFLVLVYMNAKYIRQLHLEIAHKFSYDNIIKAISLSCLLCISTPTVG